MSREDAAALGYQDLDLVCVSCFRAFVFTSGEQLFYAQKAFTSMPKRCAPCREKRRPHMIAGRRRWQPGT